MATSKSHLVIALASASVGDRIGTDLPRNLNETLRAIKGLAKAVDKG